MIILVAIFLIIGLFFGAVGTIGVLRMPDVYGKLHASTCIATLATISTSIAGVLYAIHAGMTAATIIKLIMFALLVLFTNPISNHALTKTAVRIGCLPAKKFVLDDYTADFGVDEATVLWKDHSGLISESISSDELEDMIVDGTGDLPWHLLYPEQMDEDPEFHEDIIV